MMKTKTIGLAKLGDNSYQKVPIGLSQVQQLKLNLSRSGAVTSLTFCYPPGTGPAPTPGTDPAPTPGASGSPTISPTNSPTPNGPSFAPSRVTESPSEIPSAAQCLRSTDKDTHRYANKVSNGVAHRNTCDKHPNYQSNGFANGKSSYIGATNSPDAPVSTPTASPGDCVVANITFDEAGLEAGMYLSDQYYDDYGLLLSATGGFGTEPRLFDSANPGDDVDLGAPNENCVDGPGPGVGEGGEPGKPGVNCNPLGNVLIIQEDPAENPTMTKMEAPSHFRSPRKLSMCMISACLILTTQVISLSCLITETVSRRSSLALTSWATTLGSPLRSTRQMLSSSSLLSPVPAP